MAHDILIVDDEADIRMLIAGVLRDEGYATREAANSAETFAAIQARQPTLVILDIWLQGSELDGIEILRRLREEMPSVPVLMISGHGTIETAVEAIKMGAYDFIEKPFKSDRLLLFVARAIEAAALRRENDELRLRAGGELDLVGASPPINQLRQQIDRVAPTGSRVLVTGPPGVASRTVDVGWEAAGISEATTMPVFAVVTEALPPGPVAVTTQTIVVPMSAAEMPTRDGVSWVPVTLIKPDSAWISRS